MSKVTYMPTQRTKTLTQSHITSILSKIESSEFGGMLTKAADVNFGYLETGRGSPRVSDACGVCITIWKDRDRATGRCLNVIFADNVGKDGYKAFHALEDFVAPERYSSFFGA